MAVVRLIAQSDPAERRARPAATNEPDRVDVEQERGYALPVPRLRVEHVRRADDSVGVWRRPGLL